MKIKICCIKNIEEAELAVKCGADALGLVSEMPSGPGVIDENTIAEIAKAVPSHIDTFLLTSKVTAEEIAAQHKKCGTTTLQLVDELNVAEYSDLRKALPNVKLVQVIHVRSEEDINYAVKIQSYVDALLLDSGNPDKGVKELGGTGRTHNWNLSRTIVERCGLPVFLAGGLNLHNATLAVNKVKPYGLDICSGVRTDGNLDENKLRVFIENALRASGIN